MKAAHGSPPQTRPSRHPDPDPSNSCNESVKTCSGSKSRIQRMIMPPFLRLDSAGEGASYDRPGKEGVGHQRTNTCRQGASLGGNSVFGKLMCFAPRQTRSSNLLDPSRVQNGFCALDELMDSKKSVGNVTMAGKPHVNATRTNLPHLNRYGQWGTTCPNYAILPRGVFPCHVFQACQSQRNPSSTWGSTSGHFILKCGTGMASLGNSMLNAFSEFSAKHMDSPPLQKMEVSSSSSGDKPYYRESKGSEKFCAGQNGEKRTCTQKKICAQTRVADRDKDTDTASGKIRNGRDSQCCGKMVNQEKSTIRTTELEHSSVQLEKQNGVENLNCDCESSDESEQCEGAECRPILENRNLYKSTSAHENTKLHSIVPGNVGRVDVQSSVKNELPFEFFDCEEKEDVENNSNTDCECDCEENINCEENEDLENYYNTDDTDEIWNCFESKQLSLSNFCMKPKNQLDKKEMRQEEAEGKRVPKPCPAVTERWRKMYVSVSSCAGRQNCKVSFHCGEGKDLVYEFAKAEEEGFTVMEIQKAKDLNKQHSGKAAALLQTDCTDKVEAIECTDKVEAIECTDKVEAIQGGEGNTGSDTRARQEKNADAEHALENLRLLLADQICDTDDSDSEDESEDDLCDESKEDVDEEEDDSDDDIVFENE